jgi:hypothetical protein
MAVTSVLSLPIPILADPAGRVLLGSVGAARDHVGNDSEGHECERDPSEVYKSALHLYSRSGHEVTRV